MAGGGLPWRSLTAHNGAASGAGQPPAGSEPKSLVKRLSKAFRKAGRLSSTPVAEIQSQEGLAERHDGCIRRSSAPTAASNLTCCASLPYLDQGGQWGEALRRSPSSDGQWQLRQSQSSHSLGMAEAAALEGSPAHYRSMCDRMPQWDAMTAASTKGFSSGSPSFVDRTPSWTSYMTTTPRGAASNCSTPRLSPDSWLAQQAQAGIGPNGSPLSVTPCSGFRPPGSCEIFYMYSSPLYYSALDVRSEVELLSEAIADSRAIADSPANVNLNVGAATVGSLTKLLTLAHARRGLVLHLAAHGVYDPERGVGLVLEDIKGVPHVLWREELEELLGLRERGLRNISLLFLSACRSEELAQIFVECGCRHVVAIRQDVHDSSARRFSQQFYLSLAVGESLLGAWESASCALRLEADKNLAKEADYFVLFGQRGAERATLEVLCGVEESPRNLPEVCSQMREFEDAAVFFGAKLPPRPENFVGRSKEIHELFMVFSGSRGRRAIAVSGPKGIGKSALGIEFAHFATAPGRQFSCSAMIVKLESCDVDGLMTAIEEQLDSLAAHWQVPVQRSMSASSRSLSARSGDSRPGSACSASCSDSLHSLDLSGEGDALSFLFPAHKRIIRGLERLAKCRRKMLLIVDDEAGAVSKSSEVRRLLGDFLGHTMLLQILVLSRDPVYKPLGNIKVTNVPLKGLELQDVAKLFLQRIHRPLDPRDFRPTVCGAGQYSELPLPLGAVPNGPGDPGGGGCFMGARAELPTAEVYSYPLAMRQLCANGGHPLLRRLDGNPGLIHAVSSRVAPCGSSLHELAAQNDLLDVVCSPVAAGSAPCEGFSAKPVSSLHSTAAPAPLIQQALPLQATAPLQAPPSQEDASPSSFEVPPLPGLEANSHTS